MGQHFLKDDNIARKIANSLQLTGAFDYVLEVGGGTGALTKHLADNKNYSLYVIDIDSESVEYLKETFSLPPEHLLHADILKTDLSALFRKPFAVIGNFPYNISSQILFKILEHRDLIPEAVGMFQKEVAERIAAKHGNKTYGILSVLVQAFYKVEYLFSVSPSVFQPPPKVTSAVIRLTRLEQMLHPGDVKLLFEVVKTAFNQRRKTLRNSLKKITGSQPFENPYADKRAEQLSVSDFMLLAQLIKKSRNK